MSMTDKAETALDLDELRQPWRYEPLDQTIYANGPKGEYYVAMIRGWGHYTGKGHGALGLPSEQAILIQNAIGERIAKLPELERELAVEKARVAELGKERLALFNIVGAASDLHVSMSSKEFAELQSVENCQAKFLDLLQDYENEYLQDDCRDCAACAEYQKQSES